jgi:hypothetical protein
MIADRWPILFGNVHPTDFIVVTSVRDQIQGYNNNEAGWWRFPYELISKHFREQPPNDKFHIIVSI